MENFVPTIVFLIGIVLSFNLGGMGIERIIEGQKNNQK